MAYSPREGRTEDFQKNLPLDFFSYVMWLFLFYFSNPGGFFGSRFLLGLVDLEYSGLRPRSQARLVSGT